MKYLNKTVGKMGEDLACTFLQERNYKIIERNWGNKWGEIDIICLTRFCTYAFVEVKTKVGNYYGTPEEMVGKRKLFQIQRMAETYAPALKQRKQVDVLAVVLNPDYSVKRIDLYEGVYSL